MTDYYGLANPNSFNFMDWLKSNKGYLIAAVLFIIAGAKALGWLTDAQALVLTSLIGGLGVAVIHAGVEANKKEIAATKEELAAKHL